jgi:putative tryptophan/tyrosine transport system substrate-binding protein
MRRREFIAGLGGVAACPLASRAQQPSRVRRVGVLLTHDESDPLAKARRAWFMQGLAELGWVEGRNLRLDVRYASENVDRVRMFAKELVDLQPDVLAVNGGVVTRMMQQQTQTIPIIFIVAGDAVASGLVRNIARPEGNTTGISNNFPSFGSKWLELLKEAVPGITRVAVVFSPEFATAAYLPSIEAAAAQYAVKAIRTPVRNAIEIESALDAFATEPSGGLVVVPPPFNGTDRELMNRLALHHRLPGIYPDKVVVAEGGLMSYSSDTNDLFRHAGPSYVDRILRGAKVSELPVQFPTKFELVINLKTAKAMGLEIPSLLLARADEVIE